MTTTIMEKFPKAVLDDEHVLVTEAKAGSYEAFEELVNRYERKIYRLGLNITGNREDAEDVLQEAFMKAFKHLQSFREGSRFYTWLVRIAVNEGLMKLRKRRSDRSVQMEDSTDDEGRVMTREFIDWGPSPEEQYATTELEEILKRAVETLPENFRTVFMLRDVEKLSTEETAEVLEISLGAVKARLFRARLRLRDELSKIFKGSRQ